MDRINHKPVRLAERCVATSPKLVTPHALLRSILRSSTDKKQRRKGSPMLRRMEMAASEPIAISLEYDDARSLWKCANAADVSLTQLDRGSTLLRMMNDDVKAELSAFHRHVILRNSVRKGQNLSQIMLMIGSEGGFLEILPIDDLVQSLIENGVKGDGDVLALCRWNLRADGMPVYAHQPGRCAEVSRVGPFELIAEDPRVLVTLIDECAAEADAQGGTWLRRRPTESTVSDSSFRSPGVFALAEDL